MSERTDLQSDSSVLIVDHDEEVSEILESLSYRLKAFGLRIDHIPETKGKYRNSWDAWRITKIAEPDAR